jgi:putative solute:sodium symporter small subunit|tara:strand:+ start:130 stop:498 length:369 start_codon:yes stop_codon:yes gene_type:complete
LVGSERVVAKDINLDKMINPQNSKVKVYWKKNIRIVLSLLAVWFFVSFGMGILLVDVLDNFRIFGFKLGFWMAQQGSIFCFVILIFVYVYRMNKLDHQYDMDEDQDNFVPDDIYRPDKDSQE